MKIKAAVVNEHGAQFTIEEVDLAEPKADEILVKMVSSGICHTDEAARIGEIPIPKPLVLGHEGAGIVEAVGSDVTDFAVGDHVGLSYGYCGECRPCKSGKPYACEHTNEIIFGGKMHDGTTRLSRDGEPIGAFFAQSSFASHAIVKSDFAVKLDPDFDLAFAGPLGCGFQTGAGIVLNCLKSTPQDSIAIFGCGSVGMAAIMAGKIAGCKNVIAVGGNPRSLEIAKQVGATHTINRKEVETIEGAIREIVPDGVDAAIDTSGVESMIKSAIASCNYLGKIVTAAMCDLHINTAQELNAKSLIGVSEGYSVPKEFIPQLIEYYKQGLFPIDKIITKFDFEQINEAFEASHSSDVIKAVLMM